MERLDGDVLHFVDFSFPSKFAEDTSSNITQQMADTGSTPPQPALQNAEGCNHHHLLRNGEGEHLCHTSPPTPRQLLSPTCSVTHLSKGSSLCSNTQPPSMDVVSHLISFPTEEVAAQHHPRSSSAPNTLPPRGVVMPPTYPPLEGRLCPNPPFSWGSTAPISAPTGLWC